MMFRILILQSLGNLLLTSFASINFFKLFLYGAEKNFYLAQHYRLAVFCRYRDLRSSLSASGRCRLTAFSGWLV